LCGPNGLQLLITINVLALSYILFFYLNNLGSAASEHTHTHIFAMSVDETMNGNNATGVNYSIEDIVIKTFDIYGSNYPLPV
jgi:hypothetical protein